jgi:hypothetical protein|tara:strand:- start:196 stop:363 length:168 start_codon:yes stop_codon:yes gene_type:complete
MFANLSFIDVFKSFDDDILIEMATEDPSQLKKMCIYLTLEIQLDKEKMVESKDIN